MKLDLINLALAKMNQDPVYSIDETDTTPSRGRKILAIYDAVYRRILLSSRAEVLKRRVLLDADTQTADIPGDGVYPYVFRLPEGALGFVGLPDGRACEIGIIKIANVDVEVIRATGNGQMLCSIYFRVAEAALPPDLFDAVAWALAAEVWVGLTGDYAGARMARKEVDRALLGVRIRPAQSSELAPERGDATGGIRRSCI